MNKRYLLVICIILCVILSIHAAAAHDIELDNASGEVSTSSLLNVNEQLQSGNDSEILEISSDSNIMEAGEGSFSDLQSLIDGNSEVTLDKNYKFDASKDSALKDGIKINKAITISGNNLFTIDGDNQARIFDITGSNVILKDISLINANSDGNGGAISITAGSGTNIDNVTISKASSAGDGGAIYLSGDATAVQLKDIKIDHATAGRYGGGIYTDTKMMSWNDLVDFNSIKITYSTAIYGGAFFLNSLASANNFEFNHNVALEKGGAIYFNASYPENMEGYLFNSTFINNTAKDGGALYLYGSNGAFKNITLINNRATGSNASSGGAMSVIGVNWKIVDGYAFNNTASGDGGAVYWTGNKGLIDNVTFIKNAASYIGGGVYFEGTSNTVVQNSKFTNNDAGTNGGAIDWSTGSNYCILINSNFTNNSAERSGGAIYVRGDHVSIYGSKFESNEAKGTTHSDNRNPNKYTTLGGNGGAIIYIGSYGHVENSSFIENIADKSGGAIYLQRNTNTSFIKSSFINNIAGDDGGAIDLYERAKYANIIDSNFTNNTAGGDGGAVNFATGSSNANIHNSNFNNNTARSNGGALCWQGTEGNVSYCNFSYNRATGERLLYDMTLTMDNIFVVEALPTASSSTKNRLYVLDKSAGIDNITYVSYVTVQKDDDYEWLKLEEINIVNDTAPSAQDWGIDRFFGGDGGAILWSGNVATIDHCIFIGSESARRGGGAYMTGGDNVTFSNCYFENGTSGTNGGGVDWLAGANYGKLINCTFIHNDATRSAGAIYYDGDYGEFVNVRIIDNHAHGNIDKMSSINGVDFAGWDTSHWDTNTTGGDAGAIMLTGSHIIVYNVTFINNSAVGRGGAVFIQDNINVTFELCKFINNTALGTAQNTYNDDKDLGSGLNMLLTGHGGAIGFDIGADEGKILSCTFTNNTAALDGGAINFATGSSNAYIFNSTFDYNTAKRNGGALCWEGTQGNVSYCNFSYNKASGEFLPLGVSLTMDDFKVVSELPAASSATMNKLYVLDKSVDKNNITYVSYVTVENEGVYSWLLLESINIVNDTAPSAQDWGLDRFFGGGGGAILWSGNVATIDHCIFVGSESARRGGGAYMTGGDNVTFSNCYFENGTSGTNGGGVDWLAGANYGKLINCTFIHNNATRSAGAIYYDGNYGEFTNVKIIDNHAHGNVDEMHSINGVDFAGWDTSHWDTNTTGGDGGAMMITGSHIIIYNVTFANNSAVGRGGALFIQDNENVTFELCKFENNQALGTAQNTYNDDKDLGSGLNMLLTGHGGAIGFDVGANNGNIISCTFTNNTAALDGGAINFAKGSSNAYIFNSTFDNNTAKRNGGALCWEGTQGNVSYCNFTNNIATGEFLPLGMTLTMNDILIVSELPAASSATMNKLYVLDKSAGKDNITYISYGTVEKDGVYSWLLFEEINVVNDTAPSAQDWGLDRFFGGDGGAILWSGNVATIDHCIFVGSESARRGGAAYMTGGDNVTFSNCYFENGTSGTNGGGVDWLAGANYGKLINCSFINNNAARSAGAIYYDGDYGEFTNIRIIDNHANGGSLKSGKVNYAGWDTSHWDTNTTGGDAGAFMITGDNIIIYNATFINNSAVGRGGAMFLQDNANVTFDLCYFENNTALGIANNTWEDYESEYDGSGYDYKLTGHGGAIAFDVGAHDALIKNSEFVNNHARRDGGAINLAKGSFNGTIENTKFINNYAGDDGGAINWEGNLGLVNNVTCYNNTARAFVDSMTGASTSKGGTICLTGNDVTIIGSNFTLSTVLYNKGKLNETDGGAIFLTGNNTKIINTTFDKCWAPNHAGAIYVIGNDALIENCTFENCNATERGGSILVSGLNAKIINSTFENSGVNKNTGLGGSIYITGNHATIVGSEFMNSTAFQGGVIYLEGDYCNVSYSSFHNSYAAKDGGAMYSTGSNSGVYYSNFTENVAEYDGGGIYWYGGKFSTHDSVVGCIFTGNIAYAKGIKTTNRTTFGGGALYWSENGAYGTLKDSKFYNNSVQSTQKADGGAVLWDKSSHGIIDNCTFEGNYITSTYSTSTDMWVQGGALFLRAKSNFTISNCDFKNSSSDSEAGAIYLSNTNPISPVDILVINTTFTDNSVNAKGPNKFGGGAVQVKESTNVKFVNVTFINNAANNGGALAVIALKGKLELYDCTFIGNNATDNGGSIYNNYPFYIYDSTISDGFANNGGGIYAAEKFTSNNMTFINNTAANDGGGVYVNVESITLNNMKFMNNTALNRGGGMFINRKGAVVSNLNMTGNKADTGSAMYIINNTTLSNIYLLKNQAKSGSFTYTSNFLSTKRVDIRFRGNDNLFNAIFFRPNYSLTATNITFWDAEGINNTGADPVSFTSSWTPVDEAGQNITISVFDGDGKLLARQSFLTNKNGRISVPLKTLIPDVPESDYDNIYIESEVDDTYYTYLKITTREASEITANATKIKYHSNSTVNVKVTDGATGNVSIYINDTFLGNITLDQSKGSINISTLINGTYLPVGKYNLTIIYNGNAKYEESNTTAILEIIKTESVTLLNVTTAGYDVIINVTVINNDTDIAPNPNDITGYVTLNVAGRIIRVELENGTGVAYAYNIQSKIVPIFAEYSGDDNYLISTNNTYAEITEKIRTFLEIEVNTNDIMVNETIQINVTVTPGDGSAVNGNITIILDNVEYHVSLNNSKASFNKTGLSAGYKVVAVIFEGTDSLAPSSGFGNFTVHKYDAFVKIEVENTTYGSDKVINISVPKDANGFVNVTINGSEFNYKYSLEIKEGTVIIPLSFFGIDVYNVTVSFEDGKYKFTTNSTLFNISKLTPEIVIKADNVTYGNDTVIVVSVSGVDNGNVTVKINDTFIVFDEELLTDGQATFIIKNLAVGNYTIEAFYNGNKINNNNSAKANFSVSKCSPVIEIIAEDIYYGEVEHIIVKVNAKGNITIKVAGNETNITLSDDGTSVIHIILKAVNDERQLEIINGQAEVYVYNLAVGNYPIEVIYHGNDNYAESTADADFNVYQIVSDFDVEVHNVDIWDMEYINVTGFVNETGNVTININGNNHSVKIIDGVARFNTSDLKIGTNTVWVYYPGDKNYTANNISKTFTVKQKTPNVNVTAKNITVGNDAVITINIPSNATGYVILSGNFTGNKIILESGDFENGVANIVIKGLLSGKYGVHIKYYGTADDNYTVAENDTTFNVSKSDITLTITVEDINFTESANITLTVPDDAAGNITIKLNGTDKIITLPIVNGKVNWIVSGLASGNYTVVANYSGSDKYSINSTNKTFKVKQIKPDLEIVSVTVDALTNATIVVKVNGTDGASINIVVNDVVYPAVVENGVAKVTVDVLPVGKYNITATYIEDKNYTAASVTLADGLNVIRTVDYLINLSAVNITVGADELITVNVPVDADGNVTIWIGENNYTNVTNNGVAKFNISGLVVGDYSVNATLVNDSKYDEKTAFGSFKVNIDNTPINVTIKNNLIYVGDSLKVVVSVPAGASGNITIEIDGKKYSEAIDEFGNATFAIGNVTYGNKTFVASYIGDANFTANFTTANFTVNKRESFVKVETKDIGVGDVAVINVTVPENATGHVIVVIDGNEYSVNITGGNGTLAVKGLGNGTYNISAVYLGDDQYLSSNNTSKINVSKLNATLTITVNDINYTESANITVAVPEGVTGYITIKLNNTDKVITLPIVEGKVNWVVSGLGSDNYTVVANYSGSEKYNINSTNKTFKVKQIKPDMEIESVTVDSLTNAIVAVKVNGTEGASINIVVNDVVYPAVVENGVAKVTVDVLPVGKYNISATYIEDKNYTAASVTLVDGLNVIRTVDYLINLSAVNITVGADELITVNVPVDADGNVTIWIGDKNYTNTTNNGVAKFNISSLVVGDYGVNATLVNDSKYDEKTAYGSFKVTINNTPVNVTVKNDNIYVGDSVSVVVSVPVGASGNITIEIDGNKYSEAIDEFGNATFAIGNVTYGNKTFVASYIGDANFTANFSTANFTVNKRESFVKINTSDINVSDVAVINVTVPKNATGHVIISIDGNEYNVNITGGNGTLAVKGLGNGTYNISAVYLGDDQYLSSNNTSKINVSKLNTTLTIIVEDINYTESANIAVTVPEGVTGYITIKLNNTDKVITLPIVEGKVNWVVSGLGSDNYTVVANYSGSEKYNINSTNKTFKVKQIKPDMEIESVTVDSLTNAIVAVKVNGTEGASINIVVNDVVYPAVVENGVAKVTVDVLPVGKYNISATYIEDKNYTAASVTLVDGLTVISAEDYLINITAINITVGADELITVNVPVDADGNVTIWIGENNYTNVTNNGVAKFNISGLAVGDYGVNATLVNDSKYGEKTAHGSFKVNINNTPVNVTIKNIDIYVGDSVSVVVSVPAGASGNITIEIDGKQYSEIIDEFGNATFAIDNVTYGNKTFVASYIGDANFTANFTTANFTVNKRESFVKINTSDINVSDVAVINVTVPKNATGHVIISIDGNEYNVNITDGNGTLTVKGLGNGTYDISAVYLGDDQYKPSINNTEKFTVSKVDATMVIDVQNITYGQAANITVTITSGATGYITLRINETKSVTLPIVEGKVNWIVEGLAADNYTVYANYSGDAKYGISNTNKSFEVGKADPELFIQSFSCVVYENGKLEISINDGTSGGKLNITVDGVKTTDVEIPADGNVLFTTHVLDDFGKTYDIIVEYGGNDNFTDGTASISGKLIKVTTYGINVYGMNITVGDEEIITVEVPNYVDDVVIWIDGANRLRNHSFSGNKATFNITDLNLKEGIYTVTATVNDTEFDYRNFTSIFTVNKTYIPMNIAVFNNASIYVGDTVKIVVSVAKDATENMTIEINNVKLTNATVNGNATFYVPDVTYGNITVVASYIGDDRYYYNSTTAGFTVNKRSSQVNVTAAGTDVGGNALIEVQVQRNATGYVTVNVNGTEYAIKLNNAGYGSVEISGLGNGTYHVNATYLGDDQYLPSSNDTETFEIAKLNVTLAIEVKDIDYGKSANITVTVTDGASGYITVRINETESVTLPIVEGKVNWIVEGLAADNYTVYANYSGDAKYNINNTDNVNKSFEVKQIAPQIIIAIGDIEIGQTATVTIYIDSNATGKLTGTIGGQLFDEPINDGMVVVTTDRLTNKTYEIEVNYAGDKNYTSTSATGSFDVSRTDKYEMNITASDIKVDDGLNVTVNVPVDAVGKVTLEVDGKNYTADIDGGKAVFANVPVPALKAGRYNITAYFGDAKYMNKTAAGVFNVVKHDMPLTIAVNNKDNIKVGDDVVINVTLPGTGEGENVTIEINGKTYDNVTNALGIAVFTVPSITYGNNTVLASYGGNNKYVYNSTTANFTVTKRPSQVNVTVDSPIHVGDNATIAVKVPGNATGYVIVNVGGNNYTVRLAGGEGSVEISGLKNQTYFINVTYIGDDQYLSSINDTQSIKVNKVQSTINLTVSDDGIIAEGHNVNITIKAPDDVTGKVDVTLHDGIRIISSYVVFVNEGTGLLIIERPEAGFYNVSAKYLENDKYVASENDTLFEVYDTAEELVIDAPDEFVNQNCTIEVMIEGNHTGEITIIIINETGGEIKQNVTLQNGTVVSIASWTLDLLPAGKYEARAVYVEKNGTKTIMHEGIRMFNICKLASQIAISDINATILVGEDECITLSISLDERANDGNISVFINGVEHKTDTSKLTVVVPNLNAGTYEVVAVYHGNDWYNESRADSSFTVNKNPAPITVNVTSSYVGDVEQINVTLPAGAYGFVLVEIDGYKLYANATDGFAQFNISGLKAGKYDINVTYIGNYKFLDNKTNASTVISKVNTTLTITVEDINYTESANITVTVPEDVTGYITVKLNNTDKVITLHIVDGKVNWIVSGLASGEYTVVANYSGSEKYNINFTNKTFKVKKIKPDMEIESVTVDSLTNAIVTVRVNGTEGATINITVNDVVYPALVENGVAQATVDVLPVGKYNITAAYVEDNNYTTASVKLVDGLNVIRTDDYLINVSTINIVVGADEIIIVNVPSDADGNVTIWIGDNKYTNTTGNGVAKFYIPGLAVDEYTVNATLVNDSKYDEKTAYGNFKVEIDVTPISVTIKDDNILVGDNVAVVVSVPAGAGGNITLEIDGKQYSEAIDEFGNAIFNIPNVTYGNKTLVAGYPGDANFTANYTAANFTVNKRQSFVKVSASDISVGGVAVINVTVPQNATGHVIVTVDDVEYNVNITGGEGTLTVKGLGNGTYDVTAVYIGDDQYLPNNNGTSINVSKLNATLTVTVEDIDYTESANITVTVPEGATGYITVKLNNTDKAITLPVVNGKVNWIVQGLASGTYDVVANYSGSEKYNINMTNKTFKVKPIAAGLEIESVTVDSLTNAVVTVKVNGTEGGIVNITVNDVVYPAVVENGVAQATVDVLPVGEYNITATYVGDENYNETSKTLANGLNVVKSSNYTINVTAIDVGAGENTTITVNVPEDAAGEVVIYVDDVKYVNSTIVNGVATFKVSQEISGKYTINATLTDAKYANKTAYTAYWVSKVEIPISIDVNDSYVGDVVKVVVTVAGDAAENISVNVGGVVLSNTTDNGKAIFYISNLTYGNKTVIASYGGDNKYLFNSTNSNFTVNKCESFVTLEISDIKVGEIAVINITVPDDADGQVIISINGTNYTATVNGGIGSISIRDLKHGYYNVAAEFLGNDKYLANTNASGLNVFKNDVAFDLTSSNITFGESELISIETDENITGIVIIEVGGKNYTTFVNEGKGNLTIPDLNAGNYNATLYFSGNDKYLNTTAKSSFTVKQGTADIRVVAENISFKEYETVIVYVNGTGTVNITVDNVTYPDNVIEDGKVTFEVPVQLNAGTYTVVVAYSGDGNYTNSSAKAEFTVSKINPEISVEAKDIVYGDVESIIINATDDGKLIIKVNGDIVGEENSGIIIKNLSGLDAGKYVVEVIYNESTNYNEASARAEFNVLKADVAITVEVSNIRVDEKETIEVTINASGEVIVNIDGERNAVPITNGTASITVDKLTNGTHNVIVIYGGDSNHNANWTSAEFNVSAIDPEMTVEVSNKHVGETEKVIVHLPQDATGYVVISIDGYDYHVDIENAGEIEFAVPDLVNKTYEVKVIYSGDDYYNSASKDASFNVEKLESAIEVKVKNITGDDVAVVEITVTSGVSGNVTVMIGDEFEQVVGVIDGVIRVVVPGLTMGDKTVTVKYNGDEKYLPSSNTTTFNVGKSKVPSDIQIISEGNDTVTVKISENATGNVTIQVDGKNFTGIVSDGVAQITLDNVTPGKHDMTVIYSGDESHSGFNINSSVTIQKREAPVEIEVSDVYVGQKALINVTLPKDSKGNVEIEIEGKKYSPVSYSDGVAQFEVEDLTAGVKTVAVIYDGDEIYNSNSATANFTVNKNPANLSVDVNDVKVGENATIEVTLPEDATGYVIVKVNGEEYVLNITNNERSLTIPVDKSGNYEVEAVYVGDDKYADGSADDSFTSAKVKPDMDVGVQDVTHTSCDLNVTLPEDATGTLTVTVDGNRTFTVPVNGSENIISIPDLDEGVHNFTVTYSGDDKYESETQNATAEISKRYIGTYILVDKTFTRWANDYAAGERGAEFHGVLMDTDGNVLANKTVQIAVNGPIYNVTTDSYGRASLMVNLANANTYTYALFFAGDEKYNASHIASSKLAVVKKVTKIVASNKKFKASAKTKSISITLQTSKNPYDGKTYLKAGKKIKLKINGKTYTAKTNSKGVAKFNIKLTKKGKYNAKISYKGSKTYMASSKTITVKIK